MNGKSKKIRETEAFVDKYIIKNGNPPTYREISEHFKLAPSVAFARCKKFRDKMGKTKDINSAGIINVKMTYQVPMEKFNRFSELLAEINNLLENK